MNDTPCMKQVRSPALGFHGDLIQLMAETYQGFILTCQCQEAPNISFRDLPENGQCMRIKLSFLCQTFRSLWPFHNFLGITTNLKVSDAGRDWGQEGKGTTEDEMAGWHQWLDGRESEWTPGVGDGQGDLACCDSWGHKELDTTERLNWTELTESVGS